MNIGNNVNIVFENDLLEEFTLETLAISRVNPGVGVLVASKNEEDNYLVSIFKVLQNKFTDYPMDSNDYSIDSEITSFQFPTEEQKYEFIECLPNMSAIDLILLISDSPQMTYN